MKKLLSFGVLFLPAIASAQGLQPITDVNYLGTRITSIINLIIYILMALAVLFIIYNVVMYLIRANSPDDRSAHIKNIGWGIVGLAIILSIWGLVNILINTFRTTPPTNTVPIIQTGDQPPVR